MYMGINVSNRLTGAAACSDLAVTFTRAVIEY